MRRRRDQITDEQSPDRSTCEHCGQPIDWDEICYTHSAHGFAECGLQVVGGTPALFMGLPVIVDPDVVPGTAEVQRRCAEPVEWYEDVAA